MNTKKLKTNTNTTINTNINSNKYKLKKTISGLPKTTDLSQICLTICLDKMSHKINLKWHEIKENMKDTFESLMENRDFVDVSLVCEDGQLVEAHKVILAASSSFFQNLLRRNPQHPHPLIFMRGVKSTDLLAIASFIYCGEVNIEEEDLDSFLDLAEELHIRGLSGQRRTKDGETRDRRFENSSIPKLVEGTLTSSEDYPTKDVVKTEPSDKKDESANLFKSESEALEHLDSKVKLLMEKTQNLVPNEKRRRRADICKVCGKEGEGPAIRDHIEANHLEKINIPCNLCEKMSGSRRALRKHKIRHHE